MRTVPPGQEITQNNQGRKGHTRKEKGEQTRINSGELRIHDAPDKSGNKSLQTVCTDNQNAHFDNGGETS